MAPPFAETGTDPTIYVLLGALATALIVLGAYVLYLHRRKGSEEKKADSEEGDEKLRIDNIGLSKRAEDLLEETLEEPVLQNELPGKMEVSKATVSNAVSELRERGLIRRKKKANTYLIEPDREKLEEQQR